MLTVYPATTAQGQVRHQTTAAKAETAKPADTMMVHMDEVMVKATRIYKRSQYQPVMVQQIDSLQQLASLNAGLDDLIKQRTPIYIKTNGPGGISTSTQRGYSGRHTQVLWKGFALNHPMLGTLDLSHIPTGFFNQVEISGGNGSSAYGSGAPGGTIQLTNGVHRSQGGFSQTIGSYGRRITSTRLALTGSQWTLQAKLHAENSNNDFKYEGEEFSNEARDWVTVEKRRTNNEMKNYQALVSGSYHTGDSRFNSAFWVMDIENNTPGSIISTTSESSQHDRGFRWLNSWNYQPEGYELRVYSYLSRSELDYFNPSNNLDSKSLSTSWSLESEYRRSLLSSLKLLAAAGFEHTAIETNNYAGVPDRNRYSGQVQLTWQPFSALHLYGATRADVYNTGSEALSPSLGANWAIMEDQLFLKAQYSRNFTVPTFNDLYWTPGGNPDLKPETSHKWETSLRYDRKGLGSSGFVELSLYYSQMDDGIRWRPAQNSNVWSPINLEFIQSRGANVLVSRNWNWKEGSLEWSATGSYTEAEIAKSRFEGDQAVNKQLVYTPKWVVKSTVDLKQNWLLAGIQYRWADKRYTTFDHSGKPLKAYQTLDADLGTRFRLEGVRLRISAQVRNVTDRDYAVVENYPMPGRNYLVNIGINFNL